MIEFSPREVVGVKRMVINFFILVFFVALLPSFGQRRKLQGTATHFMVSQEVVTLDRRKPSLFYYQERAGCVCRDVE